jgi:predicted RNA-binding protein with TRAM domain
LQDLDHSEGLILSTGRTGVFQDIQVEQGGKKKELPLLRGVTITDIGSEGNAIARVNDMVLFVPGMIPGDVVDVRVTRKRKRYMEGIAVAVTSPSPDRMATLSSLCVCGAAGGSTAV